MHTPVLVDLVIRNFDKLNGKKIIDCTLGEGGHTLAMVDAGATVLAIDADINQIDKFVAHHESIVKTGKVIVVNSNFLEIADLAKKHNFTNCDGVLFDFGLSMEQIKNTNQGFSYKPSNQPLKMTIDSNSLGAAGAADYLAYSDHEELTNIFEKYGEVIDARQIAKKIIMARKQKAIVDVSDLLKVIGDSDKKLVSKLFQALRMVVNDELEVIKLALNGAWQTMKNEAILQTISFHSGEDRVVKLWARKMGAIEVAKVVGRNISNNKFERSAVLRVLQK
jgi:16S rRNA (cytosine1402-N4)-methyltransferase